MEIKKHSVQLLCENCIIGIGGGAGNFLNSIKDTSYQDITINKDKLP